MARSDISAGRAFVELYTKDSALVKGLGRASARLKAWGASVMQIGTGLAGAGAAITAPLAAAVSYFAKAGDELEKMAARTGASVEALSELGFAAQQSGTDLSVLEKAMKRSNRVIGESLDGNGEAVETLKELGLSAQELSEQTADQRFESIVAALDGVPNAARRSALAFKLFGSAADELKPLLDGGVEGIRNLREEAANMGLTKTKEQAKAAAALTDAFSRIGNVLKSTVFNIGAALAEPLTEIIGNVQSVLTWFNKWIAKNQEIVQIVAAVGGGLLVLGGTIGGLGLTMATLGTVIGGVVTAITTIGSAVSAIGLPIIAAGGVIIAFYGTLAGAAAAWLIFTDSGREAVGIIQELFGKIAGIGCETIGGIVEALRSGDLEDAMKIAVVGLEVAWLETLATLRERWQGFVEKLLIDFATGIDRIVKYLKENLAEVLKAALDPKQALADWALGKVGDIGEGAGKTLAPLFTTDDRAQKAHLEERRQVFEELLAEQQAKIDARRNREAPVKAPKVIMPEDPRTADVKAPTIDPGLLQAEDAAAGFAKQMQEQKAANDQAKREALQQAKRAEEQRLRDQHEAEKRKAAADAIARARQAPSATTFSATALGLLGNGSNIDQQMNRNLEEIKAKAQKQVDSLTIIAREIVEAITPRFS